METVIWSLLILFMVMYFVVQPILRQRAMKKDRESHREFIENLQVGEKVLLTSGIYGILKEKQEKLLSIEISPNVVVEVMPQAVVGRETG